MALRDRPFCRVPRIPLAGTTLIALALAFVGPGPVAMSAGAQDSAPAAERRPKLVIGGIEQAPGGDERDVWLAAAIEETLTWRVRRVSELVVVPAIRVQQARRELTESDPPAWEKVAGLLGATHFLTGVCSGPPEAIELELRLAALPDGAPRVERFPAARLADVLAAATEWTCGQLGASLSEEQRERLLRPASESLAAMEFYARAQQALRSDRLREAFSYANDAVSYDMRYRPALLLLAQLEMRSGPQNYANAVKRLRVLAELARIGDDRVDRAEVELSLGIFSQLTGAHEAAQTRFDTALRLAQERNDPYGRLAAMNALSDLLGGPLDPVTGALPVEERRPIEDQRLAQAAEWQVRVLDELRRLNDVVAEAPAANRLALLYERLDRQDEAMSMHQRTLAAAERCGGGQAQATAWMFIGQWQRRKGLFEEALKSTQRCHELAAERSRPAVLIALADIYGAMQPPRWSDALTHYEKAWALLQTGADLSNQLVCARGMAAVRWELGQRREALRDLQEAIDLAHALELRDVVDLKAQLERWKATP